MDGMSTRTQNVHDGERKRRARFSRLALKVLREWFEAHKASPYPTEDEKAMLAKLSSLSIGQINTWFANARRRTVKQPARAGHDLISCFSPVDNATEVNVNVMLTSPPNPSPGSQPSEDPEASTAPRIYQCTFCTDTFKTKYDWTRHESSLHLSLKRYICCPSLPVIADETSCTTTTTHCAYCLAPDPTPDHASIHRHDQCKDRDPDERIFLRKDHLRQHLRLFHKCELLPHMNDWTLEVTFVNSRCGFCGARFSVWDERNDHLAAHFKSGAQMEQWQGCRGLDPHVVVEATAAMPPFLIGIERLGKHPFRATKRPLPSAYKPATARDEATRYSSWELLATQLQHFILQSSQTGHTISDDALRRQARRLTYGDDTSAPTAADRPEWLDLFKKAHLFDLIPSVPGGSLPLIEPRGTMHVPEDLEIYADLGLQMPASMQRLDTRRRTSFTEMFLSCAPLLKRYPRFSALEVPMERAARRFDTIRAPWPEAGVLGGMVVTGDWVFAVAVRAQMWWLPGVPLEFLGGGGEEEMGRCVEEVGHGLLEVGRFVEELEAQSQSWDLGAVLL